MCVGKIFISCSRRTVLAKVIIFMARLASLARKRGTMILIWNSNNYELFNACIYEAWGGGSILYPAQPGTPPESIPTVGSVARVQREGKDGHLVLI